MTWERHQFKFYVALKSLHWTLIVRSTVVWMRRCSFVPSKSNVHCLRSHSKMKYCQSKLGNCTTTKAHTHTLTQTNFDLNDIDLIIFPIHCTLWFRIVAGCSVVYLVNALQIQLFVCLFVSMWLPIISIPIRLYNFMCVSFLFQTNHWTISEHNCWLILKRNSINF